MTRYGCLTDTSLFIGESMRIEVLEVEGVYIDTPTPVLADYVEVAVRHDLNQLWIYPHTDLWDSFKDMDEEDNTFVKGILPSFYTYPHADARENYFECYRPEKRLLVVFSGLQPAICHSLDLPDSPQDLVRFLIGIEAILGVSFSKNCAGTGRLLLESMLKCHEHKWNDTDFKVFYEFPPSERSFFNPTPKGFKYCHMIDRNKAYLSETHNLPIGVGRAYHQMTKEFDGRCGLWRVDVLGRDPFVSLGLPSLIVSEWVDSHLVAFSLQCGYILQISEALVFDKTRVFMQPWFDCLAHSLQNSPIGYIPFLKSTANDFIGLLGRIPEKGERKKWYGRPDIRHSVIARHTINIYTVMLKILASGSLPFYSKKDSIAFLSDVPLEESLIGVTRLSKEIGEYKLVCSFPLDGMTFDSVESFETTAKEMK